MGKKAQERKVVTVQPRKAVNPQSSRSPPNRTKAAVISELIEQPRELEGQLPPFLDAILQPSPPAELSVSIPEHQEEQAGGVERGAEAEEKAESEQIVCCACGDIANRPRRWGYRNICGLSIAFVTVFCAFIGLQNLQSSINAEGGLGLASLSVLYAVFFLSGFVTPGIVRLLGTKYSLLFGFVCHLIYSLTNYHPTWYTLIPSSVAIGFASAPIWVAATTHITEVAVTIAPALKKDQNRLISMFISIFYFFFHFSQIPGNLASSLILFPYDRQDNRLNASNVSTASEITAYFNKAAPPSDDVCNVLEVTSIDRRFYNILVSAYVFFVVTGIVILLLTVDRLQSDVQLFSAGRKFELFLKRPLLDLLKVLKDARMIMIAPMAMFSGLEMSFAVGAFTEVGVNTMILYSPLIHKEVHVCRWFDQLVIFIPAGVHEWLKAVMYLQLPSKCLQ